MQCIQNIRAKMILNKKTTQCLKELNWLPIQQRIDFKILILVFKSPNKQAPKYLLEQIVKKEQRRKGLRSSTKHNLLEIPTAKRKTFASRAFSTYEPTKWNELPDNLWTCTRLETFKKLLKTHLFKLAYYLVHCKVPFIIHSAFHMALYQIP